MREGRKAGRKEGRKEGRRKEGSDTEKIKNRDLAGGKKLNISLACASHVEGHIAHIHPDFLFLKRNWVHSGVVLHSNVSL